MNSRGKVERRKHVRHPLSMTIQFYHGQSRREYPARTVNVSNGGMLMYVPVSAPVAPGHTIRINLGSQPRPEFSGLGGGPRDATIVRVEREEIAEVGYLPVGVHFIE